MMESTLKRKNPSNELLKIAKDIYAIKGAKLSVAEIAAAAGVSRPTLYKRLGNKSDILALLANNKENDIDGRIMAAVQMAATTHGFKLASIEAIAEIAGVGSATIYRRFGDKDSLIKRFIATKTPINSFPPITLGTPNTFDPNMEQIVKAMLGFMVENKTLVSLVFSGNQDDRAYLVSIREQSNSMRWRMHGFFEHYQANKRINAQVNPQDLAINLFGMIHAHAILTPTEEPIDIARATKTITRMFKSLAESHFE